MTVPDLSVEIARIKLKNPVMPAAGCFGFGEEYAQFFDLNRLGAIVVKAVTLKPVAGNPPPRVVETPSGMLNAIGWQNPGLERFLQDKLPFLRRFQVPVIVNLAGYTVGEYGELAARLEGVDGIAGLELNISCPNVREGGLAFGASPRQAALVTAAVRRNSRLPLIVKLSPNVTDIVEVAEAVVEAGAEAIALINTLTGMAVDLERRRPLLGNITGGLSGPAIKPVALYQVWRVAQRVSVPVIGMGGIASTRDALEFILAGAEAVAVGAANFKEPLLMLKIIEGLKDYLAGEGIDRITDLTGKLACPEGPPGGPGSGGSSDGAG
ncbi:MAG: dihydroorotate dehydrogenase [Firmicutes bacterium]|nr:dihydroorotate dehydrogenase [Bacillota bacterium]